MKKFEEVLFAIEKGVSIFFCVVMIVIVSTEVFCRYVLGTTLMVGIQELAKWAFIWFVIMAIAAEVYRKKHIACEFFFNKLCPEKIQPYVQIVVGAFLVFFLFAVIVTGYPYAIDQWQMKTTSANIPKTFPYLAIPVCMTFVLVHVLSQIWTNIKSIMKPKG